MSEQNIEDKLAMPFSDVSEREKARGAPPLSGVVISILNSTIPSLSVVVYTVGLKPTMISGGTAISKCKIRQTSGNDTGIIVASSESAAQLLPTAYFAV